MADLLDRIALARQAGRSQRAIQLCNLGLNRKPGPELERTLRLSRAAALVDHTQWARAEIDYRHALEHGADVRARVALSRCLVRQRRGVEAIAQLERALVDDSRDADAWQLLAEAFSAGERRQDAAHAAHKAWVLTPNAERLVTWVTALAACGRHDEVIELSEQRLADAPQQADLWTALGVSQSALGRSDAAAEAFRRALALEPDRVDAHCGLGMALLRQGRLREGFRHNEYRQKNAGDCRRLGVPPWAGESLHDEHLLVWCEQGFGDTLQFARFLPLARRLARQTTFLVAPPLVRLFKMNPSLGPIAAHHPGFGAADRQSLVMSLPHHLAVGDDISVAPVPYLFAEPDLVELWRTRLPPGPKIALVWQGNPHYAGDPWRSMPFARYEPLLAGCEGRFTFLSLQKHFGRDQLRTSAFGARVLDLADDIDNHGSAFADSLAILSQVDLLITTDTSIAHLAGGAGIPTWVLLGQVADWRWGIESECTAWYPSLRLIRQRASGDWDDVIARVLARLFLAGNRQRAESADIGDRRFA